jgi:hypothetical protein
MTAAPGGGSCWPSRAAGCDVRHGLLLLITCPHSMGTAVVHTLRSMSLQAQAAPHTIAALAAAAAASLLLLSAAAPSPCKAAEARTALALEASVFVAPAASSAASSPSLVASPLPADATADLTAAAVSAALSPAASGDFAAAAKKQDDTTVLEQQHRTATVVEGLKAVVSEGIQGANLVESRMPAVGCVCGLIALGSHVSGWLSR